MDIYPPTPDPVFDPTKELKSRVKQANDTAEAMVTTWMRSFSGFWMTPRDYPDRFFTKDQIQSMLLVDPDTVKDILADSAAFQALVQAQHPEIIGDEDGKIVPTRYFITPYDVDPDTLIITGDIRPEWQEQLEEGEEVLIPMEGGVSE